MSTVAIFMLGFLAQAFFSARILIQWFLSERSHKVVSPDLFWICSVLGSLLLLSYGVLRNDFSIVLGQIISFYVYMWNLSLKGLLRKIPSFASMLLLIAPFAALAVVLDGAGDFMERFFHNERISTLMLIYGSSGQVIFILRFVYQFLISRKAGQSVLPMGFWVISLVGSFVIVSYGIMTLDPVLILGQSMGFFSYIRNIMILRKDSQSGLPS